MKVRSTVEEKEWDWRVNDSLNNYFNELKKYNPNIKKKNRKKKSLTGGFEPPTFRLTAERSADWATRAYSYISYCISLYILDIDIFSSSLKHCSEFRIEIIKN